MARQTDHAHVVAKVLAAELRPDAKVLRQLLDIRLEREVAKSASVRRAARRQRVEDRGPKRA